MLARRFSVHRAAQIRVAGHRRPPPARRPAASGIEFVRVPPRPALHSSRASGRHAARHRPPWRLAPRSGAVSSASTRSGFARERSRVHVESRAAAAGATARTILLARRAGSHRRRERAPRACACPLRRTLRSLVRDPRRAAGDRARPARAGADRPAPAAGRTRGRRTACSRGSSRSAISARAGARARATATSPSTSASSRCPRRSATTCCCTS